MKTIAIAILITLPAALSAQALFQAANRQAERGSYYTMEPDAPRPWRVHDLVTIKIGEKVSARRSDSVETSKSMQVEAALNDWIAIDGGSHNLV